MAGRRNHTVVRKNVKTLKKIWFSSYNAEKRYSRLNFIETYILNPSFVYAGIESLLGDLVFVNLIPRSPKQLSHRRFSRDSSYPVVNGPQLLPDLQAGGGGRFGKVSQRLYSTLEVQLLLKCHFGWARVPQGGWGGGLERQNFAARSLLLLTSQPARLR